MTHLLKGDPDNHRKSKGTGIQTSKTAVGYVMTISFLLALCQGHKRGVYGDDDDAPESSESRLVLTAGKNQSLIPVSAPALTTAFTESNACATAEALLFT